MTAKSAAVTSAASALSTSSSSAAFPLYRKTTISIAHTNSEAPYAGLSATALPIDVTAKSHDCRPSSSRL